MVRDELTVEEIIDLENKLNEALEREDFAEADNLEKMLLPPRRHTRRKYKRDPELVAAVRSCVNRLITYKEAISELKNLGFPISEKTFQRIKSEIKDEKIARYDQISETAPIIQESMNLVDNVVVTMSDVMYNSPDKWQKMKAAKILLDCSVLHAKFLRFPSTW